MAKFKNDQIVNLINDDSSERFVVLVSEPDTNMDIIIKSKIDGCYYMVKESEAVVETQTFRGRFWISVSGDICFAVEDVSVAWRAGFRTFQGIVNCPDTMPSFEKWVSDLVEVEMT
jgi:hypothetical protein